MTFFFLSISLLPIAVDWSKMFWIVSWIWKERRQKKKRPIIIIIIFFLFGSNFNFSGIKRNNIDVWLIVCGYCIYSFDCGSVFFLLLSLCLCRWFLATTLLKQCVFLWWWCRLLLGKNYTRKISRMKPAAAAAVVVVATTATTTESRTEAARPKTESRNRKRQRKQKLNIWCTAVVFLPKVAPGYACSIYAKAN